MPAFSYMQSAVDIVESSPHPTNKIAATLVCADGQSISKTNGWPPAIETAFGREGKIGNASGTVHAETACILSAPSTTKDAQIFITDPPCPNCMKNLAEAGIKKLYIDHKGFDKDFAKRRGDHFEAMSLRIAERAGISVYKITRKTQEIETILATPENYAPFNEYPLHMIDGDHTRFQKAIKDEYEFYGDRPFALAVTTNNNGEKKILSACAHAAIGYSHETLESPDGKYSFILEPINRILMGAPRLGLQIEKDHVFTSRIPTAREQINLIAAHIKTLRLGDTHTARDIFGPKALKQLTQAQIMTVLKD